MPVRAHGRLGPVNRARGRDWSSFQRPITQAVTAGLSFGFCRVSNWSGTSMGTDPNFRLDWQQIAASRLVRGAYWYLIPSGGPSAAEQADFFVQQVTIAGLRGDDLLVADSEVDVPGVDGFTLAFLDRVREQTDHPVRLLIPYCNGLVGAKLVKTSEAYPSLWFAWPPSVAGEEPDPSHWAPATWQKWAFWQNGTSRQNDGEVVDADVFDGTAAQLRSFVAGAAPATARIEEDPMLLNKGAGATTPVALPNGATEVRFYTNHAAKINVDLRNGTEEEKDLSYRSAQVSKIPSGVHAIVVHRLDDGAGDVSCVIAG